MNVNEINNYKKFLHPLVVIIVFAFVVRVFNLDYNSPFLDEAQYIVIGKQVLTGHWEELNPFAWVGGMPLFYPTLAAVSGSGFLGVIGARLLNVIFGTVSVWLMYLFTYHLQLSSNKRHNRLSGLIAAGFLSFLAIPLYLSRIAIYDMLSFTLLLAGLVLLVQGYNIQQPKLWQRETRYFFAAVFVFLSFLAKYITLIIFPVLFVFMIGLYHRQSKEGAILFFKYFVIPLLVMTGGYIVLTFSDLRHFLVDQVGDQTKNAVAIVQQFGRYLMIPLLVVPFGIYQLVRTKKVFWMTWLLFSSLAVPIIHLYLNSLPAAHQHSFLSAIFIIPIAAYALSFLLKEKNFAGVVVVAVIFVATSVFSYRQLQSLEQSWPNTEKVMTFINSKVTNHERILSSEDDITRLAMPKYDSQNITGFYNFEYENDQSEKAYSLALEKSFFDYTIVDEHLETDVSKLVQSSLTQHYQPIFDEHPFKVYTLTLNENEKDE